MVQHDHVGKILVTMMFGGHKIKVSKIEVMVQIIEDQQK